MSCDRFFLCLVTICSGLLISCNDNTLEKSVRDAVKDGVVTSEEWQSIVTSAQEDDLFVNEDGEVDCGQLRDYVTNFALHKMRGIEEVTFPELAQDSTTEASSTPIKIKFFLERSGSMIPYDSPKTRGDFKAAITQLINNTPQSDSDSNKLFVVNSAVFPYDKSLKSFIQSKDIFRDTKGLGDPRYTDFTCIFDSILTQTRANELSILASDLIYSTTETGIVNPEKINNEARSLTTSVFKNHSDKDVLVVKLLSDFDGTYYPYTSPNKGFHYSGDRPYYLVMSSEPGVMRRVFLDKEYAAFSDIERLKGFEDYYCFTRYNAKPYYSVLLSHKDNKGRFGAAKGSGTTIHSITNVKPDRDGETCITLAVDLSQIIISKEDKEDEDMYEIKSLSGFKIDDISEIEQEDRTPAMERYAPHATHLIVLKSEEAIKNETITISYKNQLPEWVGETNTDDDTDAGAEDFSETTFAFSHLMQGIFDAFFPSGSETSLFTITLDIKK